jgi:hypothetical protein
LKKVGDASGFIKKTQALSYDFGIFLYFSELFFIQKVMLSGLWITGPRLALSPCWTRDHGAAWPLRGSGGRCDSSERERDRSSSGFSPIALLEVGATEMTTRRFSIEAVSGAPMGRWFRA